MVCYSVAVTSLLLLTTSVTQLMLSNIVSGSCVICGYGVMF